MSVQYCPSCLSQKYEQSSCRNCGFSREEYRAAQYALPLDAMIGKYRIGVLKATSRQCQIYTGNDIETSIPVLIEEFFPSKVVGRVAGTTAVQLTQKDAGSQQRYQEACQQIWKTNQKRPLRKKDVIQANNTVYSIFELMPKVPLEAQYEAIADNPVYFRNANGKAMMTINALPIPPMPNERPYFPKGYMGNGPKTEIADATPVKPPRKKPPIVLIGVAVAVILVAVLVVVLHYHMTAENDVPENTPALLNNQHEQDGSFQTTSEVDHQGQPLITLVTQPPIEIVATSTEMVIEEPKSISSFKDFAALISINIIGETLSADELKEPMATSLKSNGSRLIYQQGDQLVPYIDEDTGIVLSKDKSSNQTSKVYVIVCQEDDEGSVRYGRIQVITLNEKDNSAIANGAVQLVLNVWKNIDAGLKTGDTITLNDVYDWWDIQSLFIEDPEAEIDLIVQANGQYKLQLVYHEGRDTRTYGVIKMAFEEEQDATSEQTVMDQSNTNAEEEEATDSGFTSVRFVISNSQRTTPAPEADEDQADGQEGDATEDERAAEDDLTEQIESMPTLAPANRQGTGSSFHY